jgi:murein endopeptidase
VNETPERRVVHKGSVGEDELEELGLSAEASDVREAASDEDAAVGDDDDDDDREDHEPAPTPRAAPQHRGSRLPWLMLAGAGALWAGAMAMRCRPADPPPAAIPQTAVPAGPTAPSREGPPVTRDDAAPPEIVADEAPVPMADSQGVPDGVPEGEPPEPGSPDLDRVPRRTTDWHADLEIPDTVRYTIRRGGSLENVSNLFKIFHHEILELNPGIGLKQELAPNTRVVVYRRVEGVKSESIGFPSDGSLAGAIPMVEGKGRRIKAIPWKTWGKDTSIAMLDRVLDKWAARGPQAQAILVGNIANRTGGRLEPHSTHQSGRDVDLGYVQKLAPGAELEWQEMTAANLDAAETWELLFLLGDSGAVEEIYIDREIQKLLYDHALGSELLSKAALAKWMEYPRPTGTPGTLITHVAGHTDHMHVRWSCVPDDKRCKSR